MISREAMAADKGIRMLLQEWAGFPSDVVMTLFG